MPVAWHLNTRLNHKWERFCQISFLKIFFEDLPKASATICFTWLLGVQGLHRNPYLQLYSFIKNTCMLTQSLYKFYERQEEYIDFTHENNPSPLPEFMPYATWLHISSNEEIEIIPHLFHLAWPWVLLWWIAYNRSYGVLGLSLSFWRPCMLLITWKCAIYHVYKPRLACQIMGDTWFSQKLPQEQKTNHRHMSKVILNLILDDLAPSPSLPLDDLLNQPDTNHESADLPRRLAGWQVIVNAYCFKSLSLGMFCYVAIANQHSNEKRFFIPS